jgi:hypothetical protein
MNLLFVWDGKREIPQDRKACVQSALSLYPDAKAFCITKQSEFMGMTVVPWENAKGQMAAFLRIPKDTYAWNDPMTFADWARFWFLAQNPNTLYLDTDCRMKARYDFETHGRDTHAGIFLLYANAANEGLSILRMLRERAEQRVNLLNDFGEKLGWEELPDHWYQHK